LLGRKSVLIGMAASVGFLVAKVTQPSSVSGDTDTRVARWAPFTAYAVGQQVISPKNDVVTAKFAHTSSATFTSDAAKWTLSSTYGALTSVAVNVLDKGAVGDGVTNSTRAFLAALATGRPVYVPGKKSAVYLVDEISAGFTSNSVMFGNATIKLRAAGPAAIIAKTAITGFRLDGLTFDANNNAMTVIRLIDCTDFDLGTTTYLGGTYAGLDLQECVDFRATTLTADNNGSPGGQVGSGIYLREKTGGTGCKRFDISSVRGSLNGLGPGLDGDTVHTSGSACTGSIGSIIARDSTRYGAKFQHIGGFVQVGEISATGCVYGVSFSASNGITVGSIHCDNNSSIGIWVDAAAQNVHVGSATVLNSGGQGVQIIQGAADITFNDLFIRVTGTGGLNGSNSRGFDCRGVTRGKIGNLTVIDAGFGASNTSEAIFVTDSDDLQLADVTVSDTRSGTARMANPGNFSTSTNVSIANFRASNCQASRILGMSTLTLTNVSIDGKHALGTGSAIIHNGQSSVVVSHNLILPPATTRVTGSSADTAQAYVTAVSATTFTVKVPAMVRADRTVYWSAGIAQ
jgi:hypothetical protein